MTDLDRQIGEAEARIAALLPATDYQILTTTPGWSSVRAAGYAAAPGPRRRWASAAKIYRAAGLTPTQYESAGRRRDVGISREGSVHLRRALIELGIGLWQRDPASRAYAQSLQARGKPGGPRPATQHRRSPDTLEGFSRWSVVDSRERPVAVVNLETRALDQPVGHGGARPASRR